MRRRVAGAAGVAGAATVTPASAAANAGTAGKPKVTLKPPASPKRVSSNTRSPAVTNRVAKKKDPIEEIFNDNDSATADVADNDIGNTEDVDNSISDIITVGDDSCTDDIDSVATADIIDLCDESAAQQAAIDIANAVEQCGDEEVGTPKRTGRAPKPKSTRGPGRPRKAGNNANITIDGVLAEPADASDLLEMSYHGPLLMKKIFSSLNVYGVKEVNLMFTREGLYISTNCRFEKNEIHYHLNGNCVLAYYCAEPTVVTVRLDLLNEALSIIGRSHNRVMLIIKHAAKDKMHIMSTDQVGGVTSKHTLPIALSTIEGDGPKWDSRADYPVKFTYPTTDFKKLVTVTARNSPSIKFAIVGRGDIVVDIPSRNNLPSSHTLDKTKFGVVSSLDEDDIIVAAISSESAKKFADNAVGDSIVISMHPEKRVCFESATDRRGDYFAVTMQVLTKNVD